MFLKLNNINKNGTIDYKGLNKNLNVFGSQYYDLDNNFCVLINSDEHIEPHEDITFITEEEYNVFANEIKSKQVPVQNPEEEIKELRNTVALMQQAINDLILGGM